jgi:hypothetical protein
MNPSSRATWWMRARVCGETLECSFSARETVATDTFAARATSRMVAANLSPDAQSLFLVGSLALF